jgi:hypothetical protein
LQDLERGALFLPRGISFWNAVRCFYYAELVFGTRCAVFTARNQFLERGALFLPRGISFWNAVRCFYRAEFVFGTRSYF